MLYPYDAQRTPRKRTKEEKKREMRGNIRELREKTIFADKNFFGPGIFNTLFNTLYFNFPISFYIFNLNLIESRW